MNFRALFSARLRREGGVLLILVLVALGTRLGGINWDQGCHLHPDERFLSMVGDALTLPSSLGEYLDSGRSPMNPYNKGFDLFVYGTLPLSITKALAVLLDVDGYDRMYLLGRGLSALADVSTLLLLVWFCVLLRRRFALHEELPLFAALFYAVAVLPIQAAHFFTVDSFLTFFMFGAFVCAFRASCAPSLLFTVLAGLLGGCALATKLPALFLFPLLAFLLALPHLKTRSPVALGGHLVLFALAAGGTLRIGDPHMFAPGTFSLTPAPLFVENIRTLRHWSRPDVWFPPAFQWIGRAPVFFSLENLLRWGLGIPYGLLMLLGGTLALRSAWQDLRQGTLRWELLATGAWVLGFFLFQSVQFSKTMRYVLPLYPFFAAFAAGGLLKLAAEIPSTWRRGALGIALLAVVLWPAAFLGIYTREHSRVAASRWIYENIAPGSVLTAEYWDDALPLPLGDKNPGLYTIQQMTVFDEESPAKEERMNAVLASADWIVLSSNRGYGSLLRLPERFPRTGQYYRDLFAGRLGFRQEAVFTSFPRIDLGIFTWEFPDEDAEEVFSVYDHPKVLLFRRVSRDMDMAPPAPQPNP